MKKPIALLGGTVILSCAAVIYSLLGDGPPTPPKLEAPSALSQEASNKNSPSKDVSSKQPLRGQAEPSFSFNRPNLGLDSPLGDQPMTIEEAVKYQEYVDGLSEEEQIALALKSTEVQLTTWGGNLEDCVRDQCKVPDPFIYASALGLTLTDLEAEAVASIGSDYTEDIQSLVLEGVTEMETLFVDTFVAKNFEIVQSKDYESWQAQQVPTKESRGLLNRVLITSSGQWNFIMKSSSADWPAAETKLQAAEDLKKAMVKRQREYIFALSQSAH